MNATIEFKAENISDDESTEILLGRTLGILHYIMFLHNCRESLDVFATIDDKGDGGILEIKNCPDWLAEDYDKFVDWVNKKVKESED